MDVRPSQREGVDSDSPLASGESPYLSFAHAGTHWHGRSSLENLFVFGDSYSSKLSVLWKSYEDDRDDVDDDDKTWVDFLASSISSRSTAITVNNFAFPGATLEHDLDGQLAQFNAQFSGKTKPEEATFVFFLGINDCGGILRENLSTLTEALFDAIRQLYSTTARNFILVDVPPTDRSPAVRSADRAVIMGLANCIKEWNDSLVARSRDFVSDNTEATMLVFSSNKVLSEILDDPGAQGFAENAKIVIGRGIWRDSLHLTTSVHEIIASRMSSALGFD